MSEEKMRVMWCERPNELELRWQPVPEVGDDDVLVRVAYTGICPWDIRAFSGLSSSVAFPRVLGHEVSGYVAAFGKNVKGLTEGQPVCPDMIIKCGVCKACRTGRENRCQRPTYLQFGGGYSDYVRVPQKNIHPIKPGTSMKAAAFMEPLACVVRGQDMLRLYPGEVQLIIGLGPIGLMHLQVGRAFGARIIASDPVPERLKKAKELGAEWIVNPLETDLAEFVAETTGGWGADAVTLSVGSARMVEQVIPMLAPGGRFNIFAGIYPKDQINLDPNAIHYGEFILTGSSDSTPRNMHQALSLITSGQVNTETLISHVVPLEELGRGLGIVKNREGLKVMVDAGGAKE
jgi:L-iditol 2-dehydrogenase